jgi:hypothetical protein
VWITRQAELEIPTELVRWQKARLCLVQLKTKPQLELGL